MTITNSQIMFLGFSLRNSPFNCDGNEGIYSVGEGEENIPKFSC